jgi:hypothetical protein
MADDMVKDVIALPVGTVARPSKANSSQDWFVRLKGAVIGFANKFVRPSTNLSWAAVRDELDKAPTASPAWPGTEVYVLVVLATHWSPAVASVLGDSHSIRLTPGRWRYEATSKTLLPTQLGECVLEVPRNTELLLTNPNAPSGGPLEQIVGKLRIGEIREILLSASPVEDVVELHPFRVKADSKAIEL